MSRPQHKRTLSQPEARPATRIRGNRIGLLVGWADGVGPLVDYPENPHGPLAARAVIPLTPEWAKKAVADKRELVLTFEAEQSDRPIVMGVLEPVTALAPARGPRSATVPTPATPSGPLSPAAQLDAKVDGKRVVIEGQDEIVLKCGQASITLRRNGRVVVRGTYVETRANGVNRIRGGTVEIN